MRLGAVQLIGLRGQGKPGNFARRLACFAVLPEQFHLVIAQACALEVRKVSELLARVLLDLPDMRKLPT